jgi:hypothetical protein
MKRGPIALAKPQRDVNVVGVEINDLIFRRNANVNIRAKSPKPVQAQHHPLSGVGRNDVDTQRLGLLLPEGRHCWWSLAITARRAVEPLEQGHLRPTLQRLDLMADSGLNHIQFGRRADEAEMTPGGLKDPQSVHRQEANKPLCPLPSVSHLAIQIRYN